MEEYFLENRVNKVVKNLANTLGDDDERTKELTDGYIEASSLDLPSTDGVNPFAVCLTDGNLMLFWPKSEDERNMWITSFEKITASNSQTLPCVDLTEESFFCVNLLKCL